MQTNKKEESKILNYILIGFVAAVATAVVVQNYRLKAVIEKKEFEKLDILEEKNELLEEINKLKVENTSISESIAVMYDVLKNSNAVSKELFEKIKERVKAKTVIHEYGEFLMRISEEIERKKRYEFFKFSIMEVSLDFYDEYKELYGEKTEEFVEKIRDIVINTIRKVDYFSKGDRSDKMYIMLPVTDISGGIILGNRLQQIIGQLTEESIVTITVSVCEVEKAENVETVMAEIERLRIEAIESGGNTIKVSKI